MTWHNYDNYGGILQAFALRKKVKDLDVDKVDFIDYASKPKEIRLYKRLTLKNIRNKVKAIKCNFSIYIKERAKLFDGFRKKYFTYSSKCENASKLYELNEQYDKFICGSDQIWAPTVFDENYFLEFVDNDSKKISYAPSIGLNQIEDENVKSKIKKLVSSFNNLSIREEKGKEILKELGINHAQVVLDPTLLLTKEEWMSCLNLANDEKESYITYYCLTSNAKYYGIAKKIAKQLHKKLIVIPGNETDYSYQDVIVASPEKFLSLILNSSLVITDSFHGTIFSINYNVPFIVFKRFKDNSLSQNSRIYNILKKVNLESRLYNNNLEYFLKSLEIDFSECNKIIESERKKSLMYLKNAVEESIKEAAETKITNLCTGCGMCATVCPQKCISIKQNEQGFYQYYIDQNKCVKCEACKKVCGQLKNDMYQVYKAKVYSACSTCEDTLKKSSSGGIAYEIARFGIENNMGIIGCEYDTNNNMARHIKIDKLEELEKLSGSKYLQSFSKSGFDALKNMKNGIVIGTPCQIASVDKYLKQRGCRDSFVLVDLICHGVPTYHLWNKFITDFKPISQIQFRSKKYGWENRTMTINNVIRIKKEKNKFYDFFLLSNVYNSSCYECKYRTSSSADIRIGDFWGKKFKNNQNGVSMVLINTKNGEDIFERLIEKNRITVQEQVVEDYYLYQQTVNTRKPDYWDELIIKLLDSNASLKVLSKEYCKEEIIYNRIVKLLLPCYDFIKKRLKRE